MMFFWSYQYISHTVVAWRKTLLVCLNSAQRRLGKMLKGDQTLSFSILHYCLVYEEERFVNYVLICLKSLQDFALTAYRHEIIISWNIRKMYQKIKLSPLHNPWTIHQIKLALPPGLDCYTNISYSFVVEKTTLANIYKM